MFKFFKFYKFYFWRIFQIFVQIFYKYFKIFQSLWWVHLCWMSLPTEILATQLQYRTWEEFMYEIFSDVFPSNQNSGVHNILCILLSASFEYIYICGISSILFLCLLYLNLFFPTGQRALVPVATRNERRASLLRALVARVELCVRPVLRAHPRAPRASSRSLSHLLVRGTSR